MGYPGKIKESGSLTILNDLLNYFVGALENFMNDLQTDEDYENNRWLPFQSEAGFGNLKYPLTRQQWYQFIDNNNILPINGNPIYTYEEPVSGWNKTMVNDWAKFKCMELGMFGSIGNGGDLTAVTKSILSGRNFPSTVYWRDCSLIYLRNALVHFDSYGSCISNTTQQPPPSELVVNTTSRNFTFTNASGKVDSDHEYSLKGGDWVSVTTKPISITANPYQIGEIEVRTKGNGYLLPSEIISNAIAVPAGSATVGFFVGYISQTEMQIEARLSIPLPLPLTINGRVTYRVIGPSALQSTPMTMHINAGSNSGTYNISTNFSGFVRDFPVNFANITFSPNPNGGINIFMGISQE